MSDLDPATRRRLRRRILRPTSRSRGLRPDGGSDAGDAGDADPSLDDLLAQLAAELRATEELPVSPTASVWLGEAHAVAADLVRDTPDRAVVHERVGHVRHLLERAGDPDNEAVDARVANALAVAETIHRRTSDAARD